MKLKKRKDKQIKIEEAIIKNLQNIIENHKFAIECNPDNSKLHKEKIQDLEEQIEYLKKKII